MSGGSSASWGGASLFSALTKLQSTSSAFTNQQTTRGGNLGSHCGDTPQHREALHSDVAHSASRNEDGTRGDGDRLSHQG